MAITTREICERALRRVGVTDQRESPEAEDFNSALDALNEMLHGWKLRGVNLTHTDLGPATTFPLADQFIEGTIYNLAARLSHEYSMPQGFDADDWFRAIQAAYMVINEVSFEKALWDMPSQHERSYI